MRILLAFGLIQGLGFLVVKALIGGASSLRSLEHWSLSFGTGSGVLALVMFYLAKGGVPLEPRLVLVMVVSLLAAVLASLAIGKRRDNVLQGDTPQSNHSKKHRAVRLSVVERVSLVVVGLSVSIAFADAVTQPLLAFDARAIWAFKAKILYFERGIYNEAFLEGERLHAKTRYPQLIPFTEALVASVSGRFDERVVKLIFPCFYLSLILLVGSELGRRFDRPHAMMATAFFASLPVFTIYANGGAASGYADIPLAFYVTALTATLVHWLETRSAKRLLLAALFTALTLFTKAEGMALVAIVFFVMVATARTWYQRPVWSLWPLLLTGLAGVVSVVPWFIYQARLPVVDENFVQLLTPANVIHGMHRWRFIAWSLAKEFFLKPHLWSLLGITAAFVLFRRPWNLRRSGFSIFLWIPVLYVMMLCLIFMVIPWQLKDLLPVALTRLLLHVAPLLFLWVCFELGSRGLVQWDRRTAGFRN